MRSKLVDIVTAGSQNITLWGPQRSPHPLGILRVNERGVKNRLKKNQLDAQLILSIFLFFNAFHTAVLKINLLETAKHNKCIGHRLQGVQYKIQQDDIFQST